MKKLYTILLFAAVVCVGAMAPSCSKDDSAGGNTPQFTLLELDFSTAFTRAITPTPGNAIEDVTVWAYEITGTGNTLQVHNDGNPVGWATKSYNTTQTTAADKMRMELPYSAENKIYRLFAVVNKEKFGTIYTPMHNGSQTAITALSSTVTYDELSTYVFEATEAMMAAAPQATQALPVSHWVDVTISSGTTANTTNPYQISMDVYRALGKASLVASMHQDSSVGARLKITGVQIGARTSSYTVAQQGFMFADVENVNSLTSPTAFGTIQDIKRGNYTTATLTPTDVTLTKTASTYSQNQFIAAKFLYENHHTGATGVIADANAAGDGQYYMVINYEYGTAADFAASAQKSATGYVALPAIVRNHNAQVDATFKIDLQGVVTLTCTVANWVQDDTPYGSEGDTQGNVNLDFDYPTYSVIAYDRDAGNNYAEVYNKPTVSHDGTQATKTFTILFQMSRAGDDIKWKPLLENNTDFEVKVYQATIQNNNSVTLNSTPEGATEFEAAEQWYAIRIVPNQALKTPAQTTEFRIVYNAPWLGTGVNESMLINGTSGAAKWPESGDNPHYIIVTQE